MCRYFKLNGYYLVTNNTKVWKEENNGMGRV